MCSYTLNFEGKLPSVLFSFTFFILVHMLMPSSHGGLPQMSDSLYMHYLPNSWFSKVACLFRIPSHGGRKKGKKKKIRNDTKSPTRVSGSQSLMSNSFSYFFLFHTLFFRCVSLCFSHDDHHFFFFQFKSSISLCRQKENFLYFGIIEESLTPFRSPFFFLWSVWTSIIWRGSPQS